MKHKGIFFIIVLVTSVFFKIEANVSIQSDTVRIKLMSDNDTAKINLINSIAEELRDYDTEKGLIYARKGLELSEKINYKLGIGQACKAMGVIFYRMGVYDAALDNSLKSLAILKEINQKDFLCRVYNNIGLVYFARLQYTKARNYMMQGLKIAIESKNKTEQSRLLHNIALIEFEKNDTRSSLNYHYQSYENARAIKDSILIGYNFCSIGKCYLKLNIKDSAKFYLEESIALFKRINNPNLIAMAYNQFADYSISIKDYNNTIKYANDAYLIGESIGNKFMKMEASDLIARAYIELNDFKNALKYKTQFYEFSDTMRNESNIKSIAYIEAKYEYDKQLKELNIKKKNEIDFSKFIAKLAIIIAFLMLIFSLVIFSFYKLKSKTNSLLIHKNEEIIELNKKLNNTNITKDKFFSIIAHDLRSPFNGILGFSNLLVEQIREKNYENILEYADIIQNSSQRTMDLLKNLLEWARLQTGSMGFNAESVELVELINETVDLFDDVAKQKSIGFIKKIPQNAPMIGDRSMISSVLRNLFSNALKFTNEGGLIEIGVEKNLKEITIMVKDNGVGIYKEDLDKLFRIEESFSTKGTQNEHGTGLGLIICKEFIEKHGGKIWVESTEGKGSSFYFNIPI